MVDVERAIQNTADANQENKGNDTHNKGVYIVDVHVNKEEAEKEDIIRSNRGEDAEFKVVSYKKRQRKEAVITGSATVENESEFEAESRKIWLYLERAENNVTNYIVISYIQKKCETEEEIICEELTTIGKNNAFKIGINEKYHEMLYKPEF